MATIVQTASATSNGPTTVVTMSASVTSGNLLVIMTGHPGGAECSPGVTGIYTDTRSSVFTNIVQSENVSGGQSNSCILLAPLTSGGPETITRNINGGNYPCSMFVAEISGVSLAASASTNAGTADGGNSVTSGNVTSALTTLILAGAASDNTAALFDSASPSGSTVVFASANGAFLVKVVGAGTYACTFGKSGGGVRYSCAAALISYTPAVPAGGGGTDEFMLGMQNAVTRRQFHLGDFN